MSAALTTAVPVLKLSDPPEIVLPLGSVNVLASGVFNETVVPDMLLPARRSAAVVVTLNVVRD